MSCHKHLIVALITLSLFSLCPACGDNDNQSSILDNPARSQYADNPNFTKYANSHFSFFYDQEMEIHEKSILFITGVLACSRDAIVFSAISPPKLFFYVLSENEVLDILAEAFKKEMGSEYSAIFNETHTECQRVIGGKNVIGYEQPFEFKSMAFTVEFYVYKNGDRVTCCMFFAADESRDLAERYFEVITDSLE